LVTNFNKVQVWVVVDGGSKSDSKSLRQTALLSAKGKKSTKNNNFATVLVKNQGAPHPFAKNPGGTPTLCPPYPPPKSTYCRTLVKIQNYKTRVPSKILV
jgi:hypothetical protein